MSFNCLQYKRREVYMHTATIQHGQINRIVLAQLAEELKYAASRMDVNEWRTLLTMALAKSARETCRSKYEGLKGLSRLGLEGWHKICRDGIVETGREFATRAKESIIVLPDRARETFIHLSRLSPAELGDELVPFVIGLVVCYSSAGGFDLEGGLPDTDLELGIGAHRNIFSHSLLIGFTAEGALRFAVEVLSGLHEKLPVERHQVWDNVQRLIRKCESTAIMGLWIGICLHFIKDAGLFSHATKPYTWLPGKHSMAFHQGLFAANSGASGVMGAAQATLES